MTRRRLLPLLLFVLLAAAALPGTAHAAGLRAGAATADITPANGGSTLGFVRPDITVKGARGRLTGRALVLDDGDTKVALLSTDLAFALEKDSLIAQIADLGYSHANVLYTGTHNHSGPEDLAPWQVSQLAKAIREADAGRVPARAGWATAQVPDVNENRSIEPHLANHGQDREPGQGKLENDPAGAEHARDTTLRVLRVERTDGRPLAAWMEFPVHLTTSTPRADLWDADLAGAANHHLHHGEFKVPGAGPGFVPLWTNGSSGDLKPVYDSYNPSATMDMLGRRIAVKALQAWKGAAGALRTELPVDVRWTRACYCGQEVEPGRRVSSSPFFGLPFLGGSQDGASIFYEPAQTEGRRRPAGTGDPVHGRKLIVPVPTDRIVHEVNPEIQAFRIGDRLLLASPGEPSVEMARRFQDAVRPALPAGVEDVVVIGLANDYLGYLTTPEEYEMQHYEGGHTVFGLWTSLLARDTFVTLTRALASGGPAPAPSKPAELGSSARTAPAVGDGGVEGKLIGGPYRTHERMDVVDIRWTGARGGVDRPADKPHLTLERRLGRAWIPADSDLGLGFAWREEAEGRYFARYDLAPELPAGTYRMRVTSARYDLTAPTFRLAPSTGLRPLGVTARRLRKGRTRLLLTAQHPPPDPSRAVLHRSISPQGGRAILRVGSKGRYVARWSAREGGWAVTVRKRIRDGAAVVLRPAALKDRKGNHNGKAATLVVGRVADAEWPPGLGPRGGETPGPGGQGNFPP